MDRGLKYSFPLSQIEVDPPYMPELFFSINFWLPSNNQKTVKINCSPIFPPNSNNCIENYSII